MKSLKGDINIHSGYFASDSSLETDEGDIVFQSVNNFNAHIISQNKYYCIAAPSVSVVTDTCDATPTPPCTVDTTMCKIGGCVPTLTVTLKASYGNTYTNIIPADNKPVAESAMVYTLDNSKFDADEVPYSSG